MKGIIFELFRQVLIAEHDEAFWDEILDACDSDGVFSAVGSYDDEALFALVDAASARTGVEKHDLIRWFGRACLPLLAARYQPFFEPHGSTKAFLLTLNDVIHPEVRKLFPGAYAPSFDFHESNPDSLSLAYRSHRNMCAFAEGLIEGAAAHFGESVSIEQSSCSRRGDQDCIIDLRFSAA